MPKAKPKKGPPRRGRPPKDASGSQVVCRVRLNPAEVKYMKAKYETLNAGLRELVRRDMQGGGS